MIGFLIFLVAWVACGVATLALWIWTEPERFSPAADYDVTIHAPERRVLGVLGWPFVLAGLGLRRFEAAVFRSKKNNLRIRAELERELAEARTEIDDLLRAAK